MAKRTNNPRLSPTFGGMTKDDPTTLDIDESGSPIVGIRGGTQVGNVGITGGINTQGQGNLALGTQTGDIGLNAGINQSGTANIGASTNIGGDTTVGIGVNSGGQVGASIGDPSIASSGDVTIGGSIGTSGVTPTVQIGDSKAASTGAQVGGAAGGAIGGYLTYGSPWGVAAGSAIGSAIGSGIGGLTSSKHSEETNKRKQIITAYKKAGLFDENKSITYPDGSTWNFDADREKDEGQTHNWKDSSKAGGKIGERPLFNYEIDYTNDLDYVAGMAGISLSRLFAGDKNKEIDQLGNALGNSFLGKVGYGKEMTNENFNAITTNAKAAYAKAGIKSKEEMMSLVNKAYADGRLEDSDAAVMKQTADMIFDNDYSKASTLMQGRWDGIKTAGKEAANRNQSSEEGGEPSGARQGKQIRVGKVYAPQISPDEAIASVQPLIDLYKKSRKEGYNEGIDKKLRAASSLASGVAMATGAYQIGNKLTDGALGQVIKDIIKGAGGSLGDFFSDEVVENEATQDLGNQLDYTPEDDPVGDLNMDLSVSEAEQTPVVDDGSASGFTLDETLDFTTQ